MKSLKKMMALVIAMVMVVAMGVTVFAEGSYGATNSHTITVTSNGTQKHTYEAYQVFKGNLNVSEGILADIQWGSGVDGAALLAALKADDTLKADFNKEEIKTAADVAKVLETYEDDASKLKAFSNLAYANKTSTVAGTGTTPGGESNNKVDITVSGDGYYNIVDVTTTAMLKDGDTASANMLQIVKDITINAKDEVLKPDKKILDAVDGTATETKVAADSSAIGDTVKFNVEIKVPDTTAYRDHFVFVMNDKLPAGITFTNAVAIKINNADLAAAYYEVTVKDGEEYKAYTVPTDPVAAAGGQEIKIVFKNFKNYVETNGLIGKTITIQYTGVVNDDAAFTTTGNENEVKFDFSNNPNHDYHGDDFDKDDPKGTTPESKTKTYTTSLKIKKVDENGTALAGAEFTLKGNSLNRTVLTGDMFVTDTAASELTDSADATYVVDKTTAYYKLKDGSYTSTAYNSETMNDTQYESTTTVYRKVSYKIAEVSTKQVELVVTTDANGIAQFTGLREGTDYTLEETHAPDGYNKIDGKSTFKIEWSDPEAEGAAAPAKDQGGFTLTETGEKKFGIAFVAADEAFEVQIQNQKGTELPSTGGIGTTIFYIVGAILVLGAGILLVTRRRMNAN